jgi:Uma2 family endonuclease
MSSLLEEGKKYTYKDYLSWPDNEQWELIHGIPYAMSPAPTRIHQQVSLAFERIIDEFLKDTSCEMYHAPLDVRLPEAGESDETNVTVVQPDILVVCDSHKLDDKGCSGPPDFIIEIMSESTAAKDMNEKLFLYEDHGVKEYWIVDIWDKTIKTYILDKNNTYLPPHLYFKTEKVEVKTLPGLIIDLSLVFPG